MRMHGLHVDSQGRFFQRMNTQGVEIIPDFVVGTWALVETISLCAAIVAVWIWFLR